MALRGIPCKAINFIGADFEVLYRLLLLCRIFAAGQVVGRGGDLSALVLGGP